MSCESEPQLHGAARELELPRGASMWFGDGRPIEDPWIVEAAVIASLTPPLNLRDNRHHPFHDTMSAARARFKAQAEALGRE